MNKVSTKRYRTSAIFHCRDCGKRWEDYNTAREKAYRHARALGHKVTGEIVTAYHYIPKEDIKDE